MKTAAKTKTKQTPRLKGHAGHVQELAETMGFTLVRSGRGSFVLYDKGDKPRAHGGLGEILGYLGVSKPGDVQPFRDLLRAILADFFWVIEQIGPENVDEAGRAEILENLLDSYEGEARLNAWIDQRIEQGIEPEAAQG
jgi:uncharacterized protein YidB (DUF937 family)